MKGDPMMGAWNGDLAENISSDTEERMPGATSHLDGFLDMTRRSCLPDGAYF
jgi:hypothetical protein